MKINKTTILSVLFFIIFSFLLYRLFQKRVLEGAGPVNYTGKKQQKKTKKINRNLSNFLRSIYKP